MVAHRYRIIIGAALLIGGCQTGSPGSQSNDDLVAVTLDANYMNLSKSSIEPTNEFAVQNLGDMASSKDTNNVMISPWSAIECFGMIRLGAKGETDEQLRRFLHQSEPALDQAKVMVKLRKSISNLMMANVIRQANGVWVKKGYPILPSFKSDTHDFYKAECKQSDFPEPGLSEVNAFVSKETNQLIPKLFDNLDASTRLVLVNAVSFKDRWSLPFAKSQTKEMPFKVSATISQSVQMMTRTGEFSYGENEKCQWVNLPYRTGLRMLVLLPKQGTSLQDVIKQKGLFAEIDAKYDSQEGTVWIPKWKSNFEWNIRTWMIQHGFSKPYEASANFGGMSSESLSLSQAIQRTYIQVDEEGTTAGAASGLTALASEAPDPNKPFEFLADHPFAYYIWAPKGIVYFAGIVRNPAI